jgi:MOSC domain-containing protein YiiM
MKTTEYYAKVLQDGHLSVPDDLELTPGELVRVIILPDNEEEELALREDFIKELKKAKEEDSRGEGLSLEEYEKRL